ncbi:MAG: 3-aminobutyryl-CoA ammonia lyase [Proteobacteria bacterium]|nr:MAG: 3-aminobutyryl-CoA ammonia lyase [Pseudomonadota bacterium]
MKTIPELRSQGAEELQLIDAVGTSLIRVRLGGEDAHYAGGLVDGAKMLKFFGDVATELLIRLDGDEGLFRAYEKVEFLAPSYAGDYVEITARLIAIGKTSRKMEFFAKKVIRPVSGSAVSAAEICEPVMVCRAVGTCVTPLELQRFRS